MARFDRQTVLVTGGTGGQGAAHVRAFHADGANVVIGTTRRERGDRLAEDLGDRCCVVQLDVADEASWSAAVAEAEHRFGRLTVLVNNAGVQNPPAPIETTEASTWRRVLDIDLTGAFFGIKAVTPALRRAGGGSITNIGSVMGTGGTAHYAPYVAAKWALRGLTRTAALELGRDGIRVTSSTRGSSRRRSSPSPPPEPPPPSPTSTRPTPSRCRGWESRPTSRRWCCSSPPRRRPS
jgi:3alpha(or 20beta)-hydroxysteroid dehydrogenase